MNVFPDQTHFPACITSFRENLRKNEPYYYRPQRSWGKVMFLQASVILLTGGVPHIPPRSRYTPPGSRHPPWSRHPPQTRHPSGSRHPPKQTHTPGSRHPPHREQTPPGTRHPPRPDTPRDQTPPPQRACCEIRSTRGRYASYWNATCFVLFF